MQSHNLRSAENNIGSSQKNASMQSLAFQIGTCFHLDHLLSQILPPIPMYEQKALLKFQTPFCNVLYSAITRCFQHCRILSFRCKLHGAEVWAPGCNMHKILLHTLFTAYSVVLAYVSFYFFIPGEKQPIIEASPVRCLSQL